MSFAAISDVATAPILGMGANFTQHVIELVPKLFLTNITTFWETLGGYMKQLTRNHPTGRTYYVHTPKLTRNVSLTRKNISKLLLSYGAKKIEDMDSEEETKSISTVDNEPDSPLPISPLLQIL